MNPRAGNTESGRVLWPVMFGLLLGLVVVAITRSGSGDPRGGEPAVVESIPTLNGLPMRLPEGISIDDVQLIEMPADSTPVAQSVTAEDGQASLRREVTGGGVYEDVDFGLSRGLEILGTVVDEFGAPLPEWIIEVQRTYRNDDWRGLAVVDASGHFVIPNCEDVAHTLSVIEPKRRSITPVLVRQGVVPGGDLLQLVVRSDMLASAEIRFVVHDPTGQPVRHAGASVVSSGGLRQGQGQVVEQEELGAYQTRPLPPGTYDLQVWAESYPVLHRNGLVLAQGDRLDLGVLTLIEGGRLLVKLKRPPGPEQAEVTIAVHREGGGVAGLLSETPEGWRSALLAPGRYRLSVSGAGVAQEVRTADVRAGETTRVDVELAVGTPHLFEIVGLAKSETAAAYEDREHGERWFTVGVQDSAGRSVTSQRYSLDYALSQGEAVRAIVQLVPGGYSAQVRIGETTVGEAAFTVNAEMDRTSVTRIDVVR